MGKFNVYFKWSRIRKRYDAMADEMGKAYAEAVAQEIRASLRKRKNPTGDNPSTPALPLLLSLDTLLVP